MSRFVIIIAVVLAFPLVLIAILMLFLSNPEAYRDQISETIEVATGYQLKIGGELSWRYWPPIAINVEQVSVSTPGSDKPFATIEGASVELDLLPLITGSAAIGVKGLSIHGLILQPVIDKDGRTNWEINATQENPDPVSEEPSPGLAVNIDAINVTDMRIDYRDESLAMRFTLDIASLSTGSIVYDTAIAVDSIEFTNVLIDFQDESSGLQFTLDIARMSADLIEYDSALVLDGINIAGAAINLQDESSGLLLSLDLVSLSTGPIQYDTSLALDGINIADVTIDYQDQSTGEHLSLDVAILSTGSLQYGTPVAVDGVDIKNVTIDYEDGSSNARYALKIVTLSTGAIQLGDEALVEFQSVDEINIAGATIDYQDQSTGEHLSLDVAILSTGFLQYGTPVAVDGVGIENMTIDYADGSSNAGYSLKIVTLSTGAIQLGDEALLEFQSVGEINIAGATIDYHDESLGEHYILEIITLASGPARFGSPVILEIEAELQDVIAEIYAKSSIRGTITANKNFDILSFKNLSSTNTVQLPDLEKFDAVITLSGEVNLGKDRLRIDRGHLQLGEFRPKFNFTIDALSTDKPEIKGEIEVPSFNPRLVMDQFNVEQIMTANADALTQASFKGGVTGDLTRFKVNQMVATLDDSAITGSLSVSLADKISATFDISLDKINVSDYLDSSLQADAAQASPSADDSELIPVELLAAYEIQGKLSIGKLDYDTYTFNDFTLTVSNSQGRFEADIRLKGYDGDVSANLNSLWQDKVSTTSRININHLDITKLTDFEWITGSLNLTSNLTFQGAMMSDAMDTLNGENNFTIVDGTLDVTPVKEVANTIDAVRGKQSSISQWPDKMPFEQLQGSHKLNHGTRENQTIEFALENILMSGSGGFDYFANHLNYDIDITLSETTEGAFQVGSSLARIRWPIHCEGAMDASPVDLCLSNNNAVQNLVVSIVEQELKRKAQEGLDKLIEDKIPEELKSLFKGLFKR